MHFPKCKSATEVDEKVQNGRKKEEEKAVNKKKYKMNFAVNLLELILMEKIMTSVLNLVKQLITLMNQMKN